MLQIGAAVSIKADALALPTIGIGRAVKVIPALLGEGQDERIAKVNLSCLNHLLS